MHILYVDDDVELRSMAVAFLLRSGHNVEVAGDGQTGLDALESGQFDLLITDHEMPRLSGLELVKALRSRGDDIPVIFSSGRIDCFDDGGSDLDVTEVLSKPFTPGELLASVARVLFKRKSLRSSHRQVFRNGTGIFQMNTAPLRWGINE